MMQKSDGSSHTDIIWAMRTQGSHQPSGFPKSRAGQAVVLAALLREVGYMHLRPRGHKERGPMLTAQEVKSLQHQSDVN